MLGVGSCEAEAYFGGALPSQQVLRTVLKMIVQQIILLLDR